MSEMAKRFIVKFDWTDDQVEMLKRLWADGLSASQIAAKLCGVSRNAVIGKVHRLGLTKRKDAQAPKPRKVPTLRRKRHEFIGRTVMAPVMEGKPLPECTDADIPIEQRKTLMELTNETCRWPVGDPANPEFYFCGAMPEIDKPYCTHHCGMAYQPHRAKDEMSESRIKFLNGGYRRKAA